MQHAVFTCFQFDAMHYRLHSTSTGMGFCCRQAPAFVQHMSGMQKQELFITVEVCRHVVKRTEYGFCNNIRENARFEACI